MTDSCCCPPEAGSEVCDLPVPDSPPAGQRLPRAVNACPECGKIGKPVATKTVKALLSVSLRAVRETKYLFCQTQTCRVVYFSANGEQTFRVEQVRERVYQKEPQAEEVFICYCFRHRAGDLRGASPEDRTTIVDDINTGIHAGQCACDVRNPQGSCCLGNVHSMIKRLEKPALAGT